MTDVSFLFKIRGHKQNGYHSIKIKNKRLMAENPEKSPSWIHFILAVQLLNILHIMSSMFTASFATICIICLSDW